MYVEPQDTGPHYWYYCDNPSGYYPYVKQCANEGWLKVEPTPAPSVPGD